MSQRGYFIAGTDTAVGKTRVATFLTRQLVDRGLKVSVMKPVAAGAELTSEGLRNDDALQLLSESNVPQHYGVVNPYCLRAPVAPHIAAREEGVTIRLDFIASAFRILAESADCVVAEGAGGWLTPISDRETMADVARALELPVLLVVGLRLGCLNHALLTVRSLEESGLAFAGWIGNQIDGTFQRVAENLEALERFLRRPAAAVLPYASGQAVGSVPFCLE